MGEDRGAAGKQSLDRRSFLKGAAAAGTAVAVGPAAQVASAAGDPVPRSADVAIVGAGLAGMTAARELLGRGKSVVILEARSRTGGRIRNAPIGGGHITELGAEFIGPTQRHVLALVREARAHLFETYDTGDVQVVTHGSVERVTGPDSINFEKLELGRLGVELDQMAEDVPVTAPWRAPEAVAWDSQTVASWLLENGFDANAIARLLDIVGAAQGASAADLSLLSFLWLVNSNGGVFQLAAIKGGHQQNRVVGGTQVLTDFLTKRLAGHIVLGAPVRVIDQRGSAVRLSTDRGVFEAGAVIVAVAPSLAGRIAYAPAMPPLRDSFTSRAAMGYTAKVFAVYRSPFWRKSGLSGVALSDTGPGRLVFDNSPPDGSLGVLLALCIGDPARRWGAKGPAARRAAVLNEFALLHGNRARHPIRYLEQIWPAEEFSRGGSTMFVPPGTFTETTSAWRDPVGRIHWASTETASVNTGTMDGAIESGKRAAAEVHGSGPVPPPTPPFTG